MLTALSAGEWKPGEAVPAERKLCQRFAVSIGTLRKAIDELVAENILIRHQGRGTFVAGHSRDQHQFRFFNVTPHEGPTTYPNVSLRTFSRGKADRTESEKLGLPAGAKVFRFTNVLSLHGEPVIVDDITLPEALFPGLTEAQLRQRPNTLYNLYQVEFGLNVIRIQERVRATQPDSRQALLLGTRRGAPVLEVRRVAYSYHDRPVEWRISRVNTQHHEYAVPGVQ